MEIRISRGDYALLQNWASDAAPQECCGLIFGGADDGGVGGADRECWRVKSVRLTDNVAKSPDSHFEIDPPALLTAQKAQRDGGQAIIGYFHSHPNGRAGPSETDAMMASHDGRIWLIIANDEITAWIFRNEEFGKDGAFFAVTIYVDEAV